MNVAEITPQNSAEILLVDDNINNLNLLSGMLAQRYRIRRAISGEIALKAIQKFTPDLILLDVTMPGLTGYEVCECLKANELTAGIPVIFISALHDVSEKVKAFSVGGVDYITKPFDISEVLIRVQNHLSLCTAQAQVIQLNQELEQRVQERTAQLLAANRSLHEEGTKLQAVQKQLRHTAFHDPLTNLPNRAHFLMQLKRCLEQAKGDPDCKFAVFFLDCDRFKVVNDSLGHAMGDLLLIAIVERLKALLPEETILARPGGDEFILLMPQIAGLGCAEMIAHQIQQALNRPFHIDTHELCVTASIGIALGDERYTSPEDILRDADTAMYQAKASGKAGFQTFHAGMYERAVKRLNLEHQMRRALREQEFSVVYQPLIAIATGAVAGFEALIRWHHPKQGFISPEDFIPIAEETGLVIPIGLWVLSEACRQAKLWQQQFAHLQGDRPWKMSVNLSVKQFADPNLIESIDQILAETQLDSRYLKLEITETALMENADTAQALLSALKSRRIELAIDDFGTGYSSLSYLHRFPVDTLKIDRFFVNPPSTLKPSSEASSAASDLIDSRDANAHNNDLRILKAAINLAHEFDMDVVAEGIETALVIEQLQEMGCEYGQGYYFSKPLTPEAMALWLEQQQGALQTAV